MAKIGGEERLGVLRETGLLDSAPEAAFDRLTRLAAGLLEVPTALVTLVDDARQFFKSARGLGEPLASRRETPLAYSFCALVVERDRELVVNDAREDPRVVDNPSVRELGVVAYAGIPIVVKEQPLGAFCVLDDKPRAWSETELALLRDLAASVVSEIELRLALRAAEQQRRMTDAIVESLGDGVLAIDTRRRFLVANSVARSWFLGAEAGEPMFEDWPRRFAAVGTDGTPLATNDGALPRALRGEPTDGLTFRVHGRDGRSEVWLEAKGRPIHDEAGKIIGALAAYRDVTERVRATEQSDQSMATILDSIGEALVVADREGRVRRMNPVAESMTGWHPSEALGRHVDVVLRIEGGDVLRARDGTTRPVTVTATPITERGTIPSGGTVYVVRDMAAIVASELRYRHLYDNAPDMFLTADVESRTIVDCNATMCRELGYDKSELLGKPVSLIYAESSREALRASFDTFPREHDVTDVERQLRRKDGRSLSVSLAIQSMNDPKSGRPCVLGVYRDISRRKQADADQAFLLELGALFDKSTESEDVLAKVSVALGTYLGVDRCLFTSVDPANDCVVFHRGHVAPHLAPLPRSVPLARLGGHARIDGLLQPFAEITDTASDPRTADLAETFAALGFRALFSTPHRRDGEWVGSFLVTSAAPRTWEEREGALVRLVGERTWLWFEHLELLAKRRAAQVAAAVRDTERRFHVLVDGVKDYAIYMLDATGHVATWNVGAERLKYYSEEEILGKPYEIFFTAEQVAAGKPRLILEQAALEGRYEEEDLRRRKDGTCFVAHVVVTALRSATGELEGYAKVTRDVTERHRRDDELARTLREREVLLQEVHHRVKNNLQVISSLINMQGRKLDEGVAKDALLECQSRVQTIALIHERLYQSTDYAHVRFAEYVRTLVANVLRVTNAAADGIDVRLAIEDLAIGVDRAVPCGLIVNELVTNVLKHGLAGRPRGELRVTLDADGGNTARLTISDNGKGLPEGFDPRAAKSMGLRLVTTLVAQLGGKLQATNDDGAKFVVTFPIVK